MKIIITGCAGFIGCHVTERFCARGHSVVGIDNLSRSGSHKNLAWLRSRRRTEFEFVQADIRDQAALATVFAANSDVACVVHEAAQVAVTTSVVNPRLDFEVNALGTFNVLEATRKYSPNAALLFASTNKVYGALEDISVREAATRYYYVDQPRGISEGQALDFHSPYGCSKGTADQYVRDYARLYGLRSVVFRQSCIYGERQFGLEDQGWVAWFAISAIRGNPITIYGNGKQVRDVLWVDDLIDLYERAVDRIDIAAGQIYNAGGGPENAISVLDAIDLLRQITGTAIAPNFKDWRPGDQKIYISDCQKARKDLGWLPRTNPRDGIARLVHWVSEAASRVKEG